MFNLTIYSNPFEDLNQLKNPYLLVRANNRFEFYKPYKNCMNKISRTPMRSSPFSIYKKSHADEWLTRIRRAILFSDYSQLKPVNFTNKKFKTLYDRVTKTIHCDHETCWENSKGTKFILNEPYHIENNYEALLNNAGLIAYKLPDNLSPYCGRWDPLPGAKPSTSSYLICDVKDDLDLFFASMHIENPENFDGQITLNQLPAWNSLIGIHYV